jgi:hypothetical protein
VKSRAYENSSEKPLCELLTKIQGVTANLPSRVTSQHYAFLVDESDFDAIFARIRDRRLAYWADPSRHQRDEMNSWDGGRGLYFDDPNGHLLEIITRPYGSGGTTTSRPHPLVAPTLDPAEHAGGHAGQPGQNGGGRLAPAERPERRDA